MKQATQSRYLSVDEKVPVRWCLQAKYFAGWDVRGGVTRLWAGERNLDELIADKDLGSQIALQTIVSFARKFENDFGKKASKTE